MTKIAKSATFREERGRRGRGDKEEDGQRGGMKEEEGGGKREEVERRGKEEEGVGEEEGGVDAREVRMSEGEGSQVQRLAA